MFYTVASKIIFAEVCAGMAASQKQARIKHTYYLSGISGLYKTNVKKKSSISQELPSCIGVCVLK